MGLLPLHPLLSHRFLSSSNQIKERKNRYIIELDAVGINPDDIEINATDNDLHISAKTETQSQERTLIHRERLNAGINQKFRFRSSIDSEQITAELKHGLLRVIVPKKAARRIAINLQNDLVEADTETPETTVDV